jgi:LDH2 family malate/lactate/ureidoglycolate dehydrogenase
MTSKTPRYQAEDLVRFGTALLDKAGLESDKSKVVAGILVEGDLLGHTTHGLQYRGTDTLRAYTLRA